MAARVFSLSSGRGASRIPAGVARLWDIRAFGMHSPVICQPRSSYGVSSLKGCSYIAYKSLQRFRFSSSASPHSADKKESQHAYSNNASGTYNAQASNKSTNGSVNSGNDTDTISDTTENNDSLAEETAGIKEVEIDLSIEDLVKLVTEKDALLKLKDKEVEKMHDKVLRGYAELENVLGRTKREAENAKKFAIQNFAKGMLDVADNLERASSIVKGSFTNIDSSKDSAGVVPLLRTLLEGVEMTEKQLLEVFRKFGMEKFDPVNEQFDPHRHNAAFKIQDASKPHDTVAIVLKPGYMLHDRVLRPAEVGVTDHPENGKE